MLLRLFASAKEILFKNYFLNLASLLLGFPYFRKALFAARGRIIINVFDVVNSFDWPLALFCCSLATRL